MAYYAALVSLVDLLEEINDPEHPYCDVFPEEHQVHASLYEKLNQLLELLEDHLPELDKESAVSLESRIRDSSYRAKDILEFRISTEFRPRKKTPGVTSFIKHLASTSRKAARRFQPQRFEGKEYYQELDRVKEEVDSIVEEIRTMKMTAQVENLRFHNDKHLATIKEKLCMKSTNLEIVSLFGAGGTGKTTLARNAFGDKLILESFDCHVWVGVSQDYHLPKVLLNIGNSLRINKEEFSRGGVVEMKTHIYQHLCGRRYIIIMDDVWNTKFWDDVKAVFPSDCNGSRVMITTREYDVAFYASSPDFVHEMQLFDENQSWNLFSERVFCPPELEDIGRSIARTCGGLPLAIVVVAGLLSKVDKKQRDWDEIARSLTASAIENDDHLANILSLSYNLLPHHLRPCFLYLGGFPEDEEIPITKLAKLWVAEGFLKPVQDKELEQQAEQYLEDLASRNLVSLTKRGSNGEFKHCSIHDVIREFCLKNATVANFLNLSENDSTITNVRRFYIPPGSNFPDRKKYSSSSISHVRSVLFFGNYWDDFDSYLSELKLLRVLDAISMEVEIFPVEVVELFHLRYLALDCIECFIPPTVFKLQNLQTLAIHGTTSLPPEIWKMSRLRHVMIGKMTLPPIPHKEGTADRVPPLKKLQTLQTVADFVFTRATTEMIPGLKKLTVLIGVDEPCENWKKFDLNELVHLRKLETLHISFDALSSEMDDAMPLPKSFVFPSNLRKLTLEGCRLPWKNMTAVGALPHLQVLKLRWNSFVGEEWEPKEDQFPRLKFLLLESLFDLKFWRAKSSHFRSLEQLHIKQCSELEEIPSEIGDISTLQLIEVHCCSKALDSALKIQKDQGERRNDVLQVHVYG